MAHRRNRRQVSVAVVDDAQGLRGVGLNELAVDTEFREACRAADGLEEFLEAVDALKGAVEIVVALGLEPEDAFGDFRQRGAVFDRQQMKMQNKKR